MKQVIGELKYIDNEVLPDFEEEIEAPNQWVVRHPEHCIHESFTISVRRMGFFHIRATLTKSNAYRFWEMISGERVI